MKLTKPEPGKPIPIEIREGVVVMLRFSFGALKELDQKHGISVFKPNSLSAMLQDQEKMIVALVAGLKESQPDVTPEWVEQNMDATVFPTLIPLLSFAMTGRWSQVAANMADDDEVESTPAPLAEQEATGSPSGPSLAMTSHSPTRNSGV